MRWCGDASAHGEHEHIENALREVCKGMPSEGVAMSDEQMLGWLRGQRDDSIALAVLAQIRAQADRGSACFLRNHERRIEQAEAALRQARGLLADAQSRAAVVADPHV